MGILRDLINAIFTYEENGYRKVRISEKPVHRIKASIKLGRPLKKREVVHHINHNKLDNSFSNLKVFKNQSAHMKEHWKYRKR